MRYRIKANPVDLQDRDAFCQFLHEMSENGWQAVRVYPFLTIFKKGRSASTWYNLSFPRRKDREANLFGVDNGIFISTGSAAGDRDWCKRVVNDYEGFTQDRRFRYFIRFLCGCVVTAMYLFTMLYLVGLFRDISEFSEPFHLTHRSFLILIALCIFFSALYAIRLFACYIDWRHLKGMEKAAALYQSYHTPRRLKRAVAVKNFLAAWSYALIAAVEVIYLLTNIL